MVQHKLFRGETLAVEGSETRVWTVRTGGEGSKAKSHPIPKEISDQFA